MSWLPEGGPAEGLTGPCCLEEHPGWCLEKSFPNGRSTSPSHVCLAVGRTEVSLRRAGVCWDLLQMQGFLVLGLHGALLWLCGSESWPWLTLLSVGWSTSCLKGTIFFSYHWPGKLSSWETDISLALQHCLNLKENTLNDTLRSFKRCKWLLIKTRKTGQNIASRVICEGTVANTVLEDFNVPGLSQPCYQIDKFSCSWWGWEATRGRRVISVLHVSQLTLLLSQVSDRVVVTFLFF